MRKTFVLWFLIFVVCLMLFACVEMTFAANWRDSSYQASLANASIEAKFQGGIIYELKDLTTGQKLISLEPDKLLAAMPLFGPKPIDLDKCEISQKTGSTSISCVYKSTGGISWTLEWSIEPGNGDIILHSKATSEQPVEELRILIPGCDIKDYTSVGITGYGTGAAVNAPWDSVFVGDPEKDSSPMVYPHPMVALFQGKNSGWFMEGRDERIGPATIMAKGTGNTVNIGFNRRFPLTSATPEMYEIRIRPYHGRWETAVDPYVEWLEKGAGFVALDKLPKEQAWISNLKTQAYIGVGNYASLDKLAKKVNPQETFVGRQAEFRNYGFDIGYPDYRITEPAKKWLKYARQLGFHVGMHFNSNGVSAMFPDLVEKFKPGMQVTGKDANGNDTYLYIYEGANRMYRVSPALKAWRDYLAAQVKEAVEAGIDVVYLDEAMAPQGKFVIDGMNGYQGMLELMQQILKENPHVAIETEQFNALTTKYGKIALSQMPLGHPLSGYIFRKFVKVVPEGVMYSPTDTELMDAFDSWGFMLPGADAEYEESGVQITEAFHKYKLVAEPNLPRKDYTVYTNHWTGGFTPVCNSAIPEEGEKLFGFKGANGVTAYFEKYPTKRGLVVYEPNKEPQWFGTRHHGIRSYPGPGLPAYRGFREYIKDWLIYDGNTVLGLDPNQSYWFDISLHPSPARFHLFKVPGDFAGVTNMEARTSSQEIGKDDMFFCLRMAGRGEIGMYVPADYDVYLNGVKLAVDSNTRQYFAMINASKTGDSGLGYYIALNQEQSKKNLEKPGGPANLIAFKKTDTELKGLWSSLPWYGSPDALKWMKGNDANGFEVAVGAIGRILGKIPEATKISIQGSYKMNETTTGSPGDGVIRINGIEILRVPHGGSPFKDVPFNVDISKYAGMYVMVEFVSDASVRGCSANWNNLKFVVEK
ncbi:MAG: DUF6259 domain-containing protein [Sedimentisphaerales bacterium]